MEVIIYLIFFIAWICGLVICFKTGRWFMLILSIIIPIVGVVIGFVGWFKHENKTK